MKKNILLLTLATLTLAACGPTFPSSSENVDPSTSENQTTTESTQPDSSSSEIDIDEEITLKTFGDLYLNSFKSIYATIKNGTKSKVCWKSSNEKVVSIFVRPDNSTEAFLTGEGYGSATVTAYLEKYPSIKVEKTFTIEKGAAMPSELFNKVTGAMKVSTDDYTLSYDLNHNETVDEHFKLETIFEEVKEYEGDAFNTTDAYQLIVKNAKNDKVRDVYKYVRGEKNLVSTEYLDFFNKVASKPVSNSDGEFSQWLAAPYQNLFADKTVVTNENFRTFDGGKTYHFVGEMASVLDIVSCLYLTNVEAEDLYFTVNENNDLTFTAFLEPFRIEPNATFRQARKFVSTISEIGTAKIPHVEPNKHEAYHDTITAALNELVFGQNYTVDYAIKNKKGTNANKRYVYKFTPNDLYGEYYFEGALDNIHGYHKETAEAYYDWHMELGATQEENKIIKDSVYANGWENVIQARYPEFNFASEIFEPVEGVNNAYQTTSDMAAVILRCLLLPPEIKFYDLVGKCNLVLDNEGNLASLQADMTDKKLSELELVATFKDVKATSVDLDWTKAENAKTPESWLELSPKLHQEMLDWNIPENLVPYLPAENGYKDHVGWSKDMATNAPKYAHLTTEAFETFETRDLFVEAYKALLVKNGFVDTETKESETGFNLYKKNNSSFQIGVGVQMRRGSFGRPPRQTYNVLIIIVSPLLVPPEA